MTHSQAPVVLVTGGSRGIGAAAVAALAQKGCFVLIHYSASQGAAEALLGRIGRQNGALVQGDLSKPGAGFAVWEASLAAAPQGRVDILVNNAALSPVCTVDDPWEKWQADWALTLQVNVQATADLVKGALPHFRAHGGGRVITLTSRAVHRGEAPGYMHYAASKAAQAALTKSIARSYARDNILAFNVSPGFTRTDMAQEWIDEYGEDYTTKDIPLGRMASAEEIGGLIAYLAIDAPASLTGATLDANGASYVR